MVAARRRLRVEGAYKGPDAFWKFQEGELKTSLPLATRMAIRK